MDLDARPYRSFIAVAETRSFSRAAERLNVSQPALSAQVRELERRLGFALFVRSSRRVDLTTEGSLFLDRARRLVTETEWVANAARDIRMNRLRIGAAHHTAMIPERNTLIDDFIGARPDIPVHVVGRSPAQLQDDLARRLIDLAISLDVESADSASDAASTATAERWVVGWRQLRLWVPEAHPMISGPTIDPAALNGIAIGMIDRSHGVRVAERIGRVLTSSGAVLTNMPERDAIAAARLSRRAGHCSVDLGWFPAAEGMISLPVQGWDLDIALVVQAAATRRRGADPFIAMLESTIRTVRSAGRPR